MLDQHEERGDPWDPEQYNKFREQRMLPFWDLLALIRPRPGMRVIDLGCGTGELTAMLAQAMPRAGDRLTFRQADIRDIDNFGDYDLVFSNAALQWVPSSEGLLARIAAELRPGSQIAVQVPKRNGHVAGGLAAEVAADAAFRDRLAPPPPRGGVLSLAEYSQLFYDHGFREQSCIEKIYGHELTHSTDVIEFLKATGLNPYLSQLNDAGRSGFLAAFRDRLIAAIGDRSPYFYQMPRLLIWGQKSSL